jgi:hypothetical protein
VRIAVLLYGHLRSFRTCAPTLRRSFLERHDADVFLHTWSRLDARTSAWWRAEHGAGEAPEVDAETLAEVEALYAPVGLLVEEQPPSRYAGNFGSGPASLAGLHFMLSSMAKANTLRKDHERETGARYELVVATRPDLLLHATLDLRAYAQEFRRHHRSCVLLARRHGQVLVGGRVYAKHLNVENIFFAPPDVMDDVMTAADLFEERYVEFGKTLPPEIDWPEEAFLHHLACQGIVPVVYLHYSGLRRLEPDAIPVDLKPVPGGGDWRPAGWKQEALARLYRRSPRWFRARVDRYLEEVRRTDRWRELARGMVGSPAEAGLPHDPQGPST